MPIVVGVQAGRVLGVIGSAHDEIVVGTIVAGHLHPRSVEVDLFRIVRCGGLGLTPFGWTRGQAHARERAKATRPGLHEPTPPSAEGAVSGLEELPSGSALLVVTRGPSAGARFLLDRDFAWAGRHPDSDILLDDITVSRRHAEFRRENGEFRIIDAGSLNGTYVNRQPVDSAVLTNHDEIRIGKFRLVFLTAPTTR